jgi:hypothetical protein
MKSLLFKNPLPIINRNTGTDFDLWSTWYNTFIPSWDLVDRTEQFKFPIRTEIYEQCRLPVLTHKHLSYKECCDKRAKEIWDASTRLNKPIGIMWSGGIDSTRVLVSFLENFPLAELKDRVQIICSEYSAVENPVFYQKYVVPNFKLINSENMPWMFDGSMLIVTGEMNDELFGTHTLKNYLSINTETYTTKFNKQNIFNYYHPRIKDERATWLLIEGVINAADKYGIVIDNEADWFWWWNFCFKWQNCYLRLLTLAMPKCWSGINRNYMNDYIHHFFGTEEFQLWAINSPDIRVIKQWKNYKYQAKKEIFDFDGDQNYFENKTKRGSLVTVFNHRNLAEAIDSDFNLIERVNASNYYDHSNNFLLNN